MRDLAIAVLLSVAAAPSSSAAASQTFVAMARTGCATDPDGPWAVIRIDLGTGDRTVLSGRRDDCTLAGAGPDLFGSGASVADVGADGQIMAMTHNGFSVTSTLWRVDPSTGDRTIVSGCVDAACSSTIGAGQQSWFSIDGHLEPPPAPPTVAALPSWGLPLLAGILLGLTARVLSRPRLAPG